MEGGAYPAQRDQGCVWLMASWDKGSARSLGTAQMAFWGGRSWSWCSSKYPGSLPGQASRLESRAERGDCTELRAKQQHVVPPLELLFRNTVTNPGHSTASPPAAALARYAWNF